MTPLDTMSLSVFTVMLAFGQVCFKRVGLVLRGHSGLEAIALVIQAPSLYVGLILYGSATLLWIWILSRVNLSSRVSVGRARNGHRAAARMVHFWRARRPNLLAGSGFHRNRRLSDSVRGFAGGLAWASETGKIAVILIS